MYKKRVRPFIRSDPILIIDIGVSYIKIIIVVKLDMFIIDGDIDIFTGLVATFVI